MNSDLSDLYQDLIIQHGKKPRNERAIEDADRHAEGYNPLCGDRVTIYLKLDDDHIEDISFTGSGCAICTASASLMTQFLKSKTRDEALAFSGSFRGLVTSSISETEIAALGKLAALAGVRKYPVRVKCATLPWHTMQAALTGDAEQISTED